MGSTAYSLSIPRDVGGVQDQRSCLPSQIASIASIRLIIMPSRPRPRHAHSSCCNCNCHDSLAILPPSDVR